METRLDHSNGIPYTTPPRADLPSLCQKSDLCPIPALNLLMPLRSGPGSQ